MSISPEQLSQLIDTHWVPLVAWVGATADAEDIVQQTFIALAGLASAPDNTRAWLYKAAKNKAINTHISSKRRRARQNKASKPEQIPAPMNSKAELSELKSLLTQLSKEQREVIAGKIWGQLTFEEIAAHQGISKASVWRIYNSAIDSLRSFYNLTCEVNQ